MILKKNVGYLDSIVRVTIGVLIVGVGLAMDSMWGFLGMIPIISGGIAFCPIYRWLGKETSPPGSERAY